MYPTQTQAQTLCSTDGKYESATSTYRTVQLPDFGIEIVTSPTSYGATFIGVIPGKEKLLEIDVSCDCEVEMKDLTDLLARVRLLK